MKYKTFEEWWDNYGSGLRPTKLEDMEEFAYRISKEAWNNDCKKNMK